MWRCAERGAAPEGSRRGRWHARRCGGQSVSACPVVARHGEAPFEIVHKRLCGRVGGEALAGLATRVHDGRVVAPAEALAALDPLDRDVFLMREVAGLSYSQ